MTTTQTRISKGVYGWKAGTDIEAPELGVNKVVTVTTMKRSGGMLATIATVQTRNGPFLSFMMFQDLNRTIDSEAIRVTEKAVSDQHKRALGNMSGFMEEAMAKYAGVAA